MADRDKEIQSSLDQGKLDPDKLESTELVSASADVIAYQRLYTRLASSTVRLKSDFSSKVMLKVICERVKRAKWESAITSFLLSGLVLALLSSSFFLLSYLDYFQLDARYTNTLISIAVSSINYAVPLLAVLVSLAGIDQLFRYWQQSA